MAGCVIDDSSGKQECAKTIVPGAVEKIAGGQQQTILPAVTETHVAGKNYCKENEERKAIEKHYRFLGFSNRGSRISNVLLLGD